MNISPVTPAGAQMRIGTLQGLRFIAAALVMIGHFQKELVTAAGAMISPVLARIPFDWGLGVDIFFVISGFVMYYLSHDKFAVPGASGMFMRRRLIRIVPLYWFFTTIVLVIALKTTGKTGDTPLYLPNIITSYFFIPGPRCGDYCFPVYTLGWTLNYEMLFYVLFSIGLMFRRAVGLTFVFGALAALVLAYALVPPSVVMIHFWGYPMVGEFLVGIGISHLFLRGVRIPRLLSLVMLAAAAVAAVLFYQTQSYDTIGRLVTGGVPAALIVAGVVLGWQSVSGGIVGRFMVLGGDASYALYLWHPFVAKGMHAVFGKLGLWAKAPMLFIPVSLVIAIISALLIHRYLELPVTRWLTRHFAGRSLPTSAAPDAPSSSPMTSAKESIS